jgi:hypothetical protein
MPQFVSCPKCGRRARVPDTLMGQQVKCPGCAETFTAAASAPVPPTGKEGKAKVEREAEGEEDIEVVDDSRRRDDDEDDRRPDRGRRSREEDDEGERRPRKKRKRRTAQGDGPWLAAIGVAAACVVVAFFFSVLVEGTAGLPPAKDGPIVKYLALGLGMIGALALIGLGVKGVKDRELVSWYYHSMQRFTGTLAVVLCMFQTAVGGFLGGWVVYGLFFTALRGR